MRTGRGVGRGRGRDAHVWGNPIRVLGKWAGNSREVKGGSEELTHPRHPTSSHPSLALAAGPQNATQTGCTRER
eukprot:9478308-Pyramimonas_sp.AAC.1